MYQKEFDDLNKKLQEQGQKAYLNPRNTAAGSLRQLDPVLTASRPLSLFTYSIVAAEGEVPVTQWDRLHYLESFGFPVSKDVHLFGTLEEAIMGCEAWNSKRVELTYEIDGMVIKINDLILAADLGYVGKDPRSAIAYKCPAREVSTKLLDIGINVGRTGVLTPYAKLEPVDIDGVVVKQATLHNFDFIQDKDIRVGDTVKVKRAGEVIPYVIGPEVKLRNGKETIFTPPDVCPECGEPIENIPGEVAWYCVNAACPEQLVRNVEHFVSRGAMDIVGLGIKIVEQLVSEGLVKDVADIFTLKKEDLLELDGFADKKADNLLVAINESRQQPLQRLIIALGMRGVGEVAAEELTKYYPDLDALSHTSKDELQLIEGFGPNISQAIVDWFASPTNLNLLEKLRRAGVWPTAEIETGDIVEDAELSGLVFVITGVLPTLSRQEAKAYIKSKGGKVTSSLSKNTSYLIVGKNPGSKLDKARELNIKLIDENELKRL
jgi:DNA ligase (NAD+)